MALERAMEEVECGRVQELDHAALLDVFGLPPIQAAVEWVLTDEFTRRYERLRGRSHKAVGAAVAAFVGDLAKLGPGAVPKGRPGLQIRRLRPDSLLPDAFALSWSSAGRAIYVIEWIRTPSGPRPRVTWLTIGPHGAPDRRRWRGNA